LAWSAVQRLRVAAHRLGMPAAPAEVHSSPHWRVRCASMKRATGFMLRCWRTSLPRRSMPRECPFRYARRTMRCVSTSAGNTGAFREAQIDAASHESSFQCEEHWTRRLIGRIPPPDSSAIRTESRVAQALTLRDRTIVSGAPKSLTNDDGRAQCIG
jgi:hypothetical protein